MSVVTIIAIEADIGGYVGHSAMDPICSQKRSDGSQSECGSGGSRSRKRPRLPHSEVNDGSRY